MRLFWCKRNIEMTPLCKIEVTHPRVLGSRAVRRGYQSAAIEERIADAGMLVLEPGDTRDGGQGVRFARR